MRIIFEENKYFQTSHHNIIIVALFEIIFDAKFTRNIAKYECPQSQKVFVVSEKSSHENIPFLYLIVADKHLNKS